mmetsp:Transcript_16804/g.43578  ORF Transcript_16804/g.43578 Transcript_16804/m.43578 type:complete len:207 (+) Transcript_16804:431-1051(+)
MRWSCAPRRRRLGWRSSCGQKSPSRACTRPRRVCRAEEALRGGTGTRTPACSTSTSTAATSSSTSWRRWVPAGTSVAGSTTHKRLRRWMELPRSCSASGTPRRTSSCTRTSRVCLPMWRTSSSGVPRSPGARWSAAPCSAASWRSGPASARTLPRWACRGAGSTRSSAAPSCLRRTCGNELACKRHRSALGPVPPSCSSQPRCGAR